MRRAKLGIVEYILSFCLHSTQTRVMTIMSRMSS